MSTFKPLVPLSWMGLASYIATLDGVQLVSHNGTAELPDEWLHHRRNYKPGSHDAYVVVGRPSRLNVVQVDPESGRFLSVIWEIRPAPEPVLVEHGRNEEFSWTLTDDDRLRFVVEGATGRLVFRLYENRHLQTYEPVLVFRSGCVDERVFCRAYGLADRIGEKVWNYRKGQPRSIPDRPAS